MLCPQLASAKYIDTWIKFFIHSFIHSFKTNQNKLNVNFLAHNVPKGNYGYLSFNINLEKNVRSSQKEFV